MSTHPAAARLSAGSLPPVTLQVHALRDALALAFLLNRTLVLPHFDCLCDRSELVDYIPWCVYPVSDGSSFERDRSEREVGCGSVLDGVW